MGRPESNDPKLLAEIGARIRDVRRATGRQAQDVARLTGVSRAVYSRIENGQQAPPLKFLITFADTFEVSIDELLARRPLAVAPSEVTLAVALVSRALLRGSIEPRDVMKFLELLNVDLDDDETDAQVATTEVWQAKRAEAAREGKKTTVEMKAKLPHPPRRS